MRIAYADPPYMGQSHRYPEKQEVDHTALIRELQGYDGWALSASTPSIQDIVPMLNSVTRDYRIGAWVKPYAVYHPNVNPAYAWEPVFFHPARGYDRTDLTVRDWISACITLERGVVGAKPDNFCFWLFRILGVQPTDDFYDLFPGSGAVTRAWDSYCGQLSMTMPIEESL